MAKSARSQVKKRFRAIKRETRSAVESERLARLAQRLAKRQKLQQTQAEQGEGSATLDTSEAMEVDDGAAVALPKKISTSGSRGSARETWKGGKLLHKKRQRSALADRKKRK